VTGPSSMVSASRDGYAEGGVEREVDNSWGGERGEVVLMAWRKVEFDETGLLGGVRGLLEEMEDRVEGAELKDTSIDVGPGLGVYVGAVACCAAFL
jgi:hypothetical protein